MNTKIRWTKTGNERWSGFVGDELVAKISLVVGVNNRPLGKYALDMAAWPGWHTFKSPKLAAQSAERHV